MVIHDIDTDDIEDLPSREDMPPVLVLHREMGGDRAWQDPGDSPSSTFTHTTTRDCLCCPYIVRSDDDSQLISTIKHWIAGKPDA